MAMTAPPRTRARELARTRWIFPLRFIAFRHGWSHGNSFASQDFKAVSTASGEPEVLKPRAGSRQTVPCPQTLQVRLRLHALAHLSRSGAKPRLQQIHDVLS